VKLICLALLLAAPADSDLKRARDRYEFGAWADAAGAVRELLATRSDLTESQRIEAYRLLGLAEYQLGDRAQARAAFVNLLSLDPDFSLDPFLVPPPIVEFFDKVKREHEPDLVPLRERKRQLKEQQRLAEEAQRKLLAEEQARSGPPTKILRVQERIYLFNWLPLGAGQFQNGQRTKGVAIAAGEVVFGLVNVGAILIHNQIASDRSRFCTVKDTSNCSNPPITDSDRRLLTRIDLARYISAGLFWGIYAYGVIDAHIYYVPRIETEMTPDQRGGTVKLSWSF
jgi:tetratricopeptide (TPR) repeat protein